MLQIERSDDGERFVLYDYELVPEGCIRAGATERRFVTEYPDLDSAVAANPAARVFDRWMDTPDEVGPEVEDTATSGAE